MFIRARWDIQNRFATRILLGSTEMRLAQFFKCHPEALRNRTILGQGKISADPHGTAVARKSEPASSSKPFLVGHAQPSMD
jgi:hypothetical protein